MTEPTIDERLDSLERFQKDYEMRFEKAFPAGDYDGHRRYHELLRERNDEIRRLRRAVLEKTISGLVWAGVVAVALMLWEGFRKKVLGQ